MTVLGKQKFFEIKYRQSWEHMLEAATEDGRVIIANFTNAYCGPGRFLNAYFQALSGEAGTLVFLEVDSDEVQDVVAECEVTAMPTFQVWKDGARVESLVGADKNKVKALVEKYNNA